MEFPQTFQSVRDKLQSLFEKVVVLGSLKSFQVDHQVDISFYITDVTALCDCRELASLTLS